MIRCFRLTQDRFRGISTQPHGRPADSLTDIVSGVRRNDGRIIVPRAWPLLCGILEDDILPYPLHAARHRLRVKLAAPSIEFVTELTRSGRETEAEQSDCSMANRYDADGPLPLDGGALAACAPQPAAHCHNGLLPPCRASLLYL